MSKAAGAFWRMYYLNVLKREKLISQDEFAELIRNRENLPLYSQRAAEYNFLTSVKDKAQS